ncbi:hypothetical protein DYB32_005648 [Aphanomyces invadans]|uniref:Receptor expression-enhancing protein n=1 Tax=Aphanomyces invadans TaxID=157072 RepID=A0A3R6Y7M9_9STRA|nr:hypothetical protein DYB32_005648 [Aphanomyces invadans]
MSVQSAKKEDATDEHIQWVVFWTVNACFAVFEILVDFLGNYIPFYYEAKVCMVAWLALPQFRGALQIYDTLIAPSFVKYEKTLDAHIDLASDKLSQLCRDAASLAMQKGAGAIVQVQTELLGHFRVLLSRGLKVRHHTKSRLLRLSPSGNYLFLESKNNRGANAPAVLSLLAIQLVDTIGSSDVYLTVETHAEKVTVEAEAKKTRDLLVAGLRLLAVAFQKQGKRDLTRLAEIAAKQKKQLAFDNLLVHCNRRNTNMRLY